MNDASDTDRDARSPATALPWHVATLETLAAEKARLPHALLFTGPAGVGKRAFALALAQALLCETPRPSGLACGECPSCRFVANRQHPDLRVLEPIEYDEDDGTTKQLEWIVVERIRELTGFVQITAHRGGAKVGIIAPAERMHPSAANALLKTLEEPPPETYLLLVSDQPGRVPVTVVSRCTRVPLGRPDRAQALQWLAQRSVADAECALAQAGGSPLAAVELAHPELQRERSIWLGALEQPSRLSPVQLAARIEAAPRDLRKGALGRVIDWLIAWCADLAAARAGGAELRNPDHQGALDRLAGQVAGPALFRYHRSLLRQRGLLAHPLQPRFVVEALLIEYRSLFH